MFHRRSCGPSGRSQTATGEATVSSPHGRTSSCTGSSSRRCLTCSLTSTPQGFRQPGAAATPFGTSPAARSRASIRTSSSTALTSSSRQPSSSTGIPSTATSRGSTSTRLPPAPTAATRPRSTASPWSASCATARRASPSASGVGCRPFRASRATWASLCRRRWRSTCCARSRTPGKRTFATASLGSRLGSSS